jgi:hypothetical protein
MTLQLGTMGMQIVCDAIDDGVLIFDESDRVAFCNAAACRHLGVRAPALLGKTSHTVVTRFLQIPRDKATLLFAGETVNCPGAAGEVDGFDVKCLRLPSQRPGGSVPADRLQETPTAMVLRDRSRAKQLRAMEDAASGSSGQWGRGADPVLDHRAILQFLSHETRRANRDGEKLSAVLVKAPLGLTYEARDAWISPVLRSTDRLGALAVARVVGDAGLDPREVTIAALAVPLHPEFSWNLVVLPFAGETGAHAVALRIRARAPAEIARSVFVGVSSLCLRRADWVVADGFDTAESLLERAYRQVLVDEETRTGPSAA